MFGDSRAQCGYSDDNENAAAQASVGHPSQENASIVGQSHDCERTENDNAQKEFFDSALKSAMERDIKKSVSQENASAISQSLDDRTENYPRKKGSFELALQSAMINTSKTNVESDTAVLESTIDKTSKSNGESETGEAKCKSPEPVVRRIFIKTRNKSTSSDSKLNLSDQKEERKRDWSPIVGPSDSRSQHSLEKNLQKKSVASKKIRLEKEDSSKSGQLAKDDNRGSKPFRFGEGSETF